MEIDSITPFSRQVSYLSSFGLGSQSYFFTVMRDTLRQKLIFEGVWHQPHARHGFEVKRVGGCSIHSTTSVTTASACSMNQQQQQQQQPTKSSAHAARAGEVTRRMWEAGGSGVDCLGHCNISRRVSLKPVWHDDTTRARV